MILLNSEINGYEQEGLNGLKIAKFLKTNLKSAKKDISIKNAIKVVKVAAPIGLSFVPIVGGTASKIGGKLLKNSSGKANILGRTVNAVNKVSKTKVGSTVVQLAKPLVKNAKTSFMQNAGINEPTSQQQEVENFENNPTTVATKDNTMLYVGGGVLVLGLAYMAFKK